MNINNYNLCYGCMAELEKNIKICPNCNHINHQEIKDCYLHEGTIIHGRYIIGRVLGHGGFGITYIAYDTRIDARVAIKEYLPGDYSIRTHNKKTVLVYDGEKKALFQKGLEKFLSEAKTMAKYNHYKGVVTTKDFIQENNTAYIVMEYLDGETVEEYLNRNEGRVSYYAMLETIYPVMETLTLLHADGIIHRDISPDNIYITKDKKIKLIDFGAAREADENEKNYSIVLKPGYAPEEQYRSKGIQGPFTDVYALAATMYKMLTGVTPIESMERSLGDKDLQPLIDFGLKMTKRQISIIEKGLSVRSKDRYQSVGEFRKALEKASSKSSIKLMFFRRLLASIIAIALIGFASYKAYNDMYLTYIPDATDALVIDVTDYLDRHDIPYSVQYAFNAEKVNKTVINQNIKNHRIKPGTKVLLEVNDTDLREVFFEDSNLNEYMKSFLEIETIYFRDVKYIKELNLSHLNLSSLKGLENLIKLEKVNLSHNNLVNVDVLANLDNLYSVDLSNNFVRNTEFVSEMTSLVSLDLSSNQLVSERLNMKNDNLVELYLQNNFLLSIGNIFLPNLKYLDISNNVIEDLTGIENESNLEILDLSYNIISDISLLSTLSNLYYMDLSYNRIENGNVLVQLDQLIQVDISNNLFDDTEFDFKDD